MFRVPLIQFDRLSLWWDMLFWDRHNFVLHTQVKLFGWVDAFQSGKCFVLCSGKYFVIF